MENKVYYNGKDISFILVAKVEHVVRLIAERDGNNFEDAYEAFSQSNTHKTLETPKTLLWTESAEFIVDEYDREQS